MMEKETKGSIPFLDIHVKKDGTKLATSVYRNPTRTDRYLHYSSHHHPKALQTASITKPNGYANGDLSW